MSRRRDMRVVFIFLLVSGVAEVSADQTRTALIAAGCVAGGLLVAAVAIGAIYCFVRLKRRVEKKPLPRYQEAGAMMNGVYRPERILRRSSTFSGTGQPPDVRVERLSLRAKAYTQHPASPRQRPPVPFYTIRSDPRLPLEVSGMIHIVPPAYSRPPQVGRPVIFLDRNGVSKQKGSTKNFMYRNSGTMLYYANGGDVIQNGNDREEQSNRRPSRESGRDRSRSQSHSRSRGPDMFTRRHSDSYGHSVLGVPGDFFLQKRAEDFNNYTRSSKPSRHDSNNNSPATEYFMDLPVTNLDNLPSNMSTKEFINNKYVPDTGRYSVTQIQPNSGVYPPTYKSVNMSQEFIQERETTLTFGDEEDDEISSTPRKDYPEDFPRMPRANTVEDKDVNNDESEAGTPRVDYLPLVTNSSHLTEAFTINASEIDDIIALSIQTNKQDSDKIINHHQSIKVTRTPSPPTIMRPPTPPFDGLESLFPYRIPFFPRHEETQPAAQSTSRIPTPPPDMSPDREDDPLSSLDFLNTPSPPPPPPLPPPAPPLPAVNIKFRPPTPPSTGIKHGNIITTDNIFNVNKSASASHDSTIHKSSSESLNCMIGLPFMEELRRRQRSIDEGVNWSPPSSTSAPSVPQDASLLDVNDRHDNVSTDSGKRTPRSQSPKYSLPHRTSVVQFAEDPPEIIPHENDYSSNRYDDMERSIDLAVSEPLKSLPPPPPPPPPLPPAFISQ